MGIVVLIVVSEKNIQTFVNKKFFAKLTKMYAVLRRNLRDLRIIASQVQRLQARNPQTTQTLVRTYMQGKGSRAEINNIWIQGMTGKSLKHHYALILMGQNITRPRLSLDGDEVMEAGDEDGW